MSYFFRVLGPAQFTEEFTFLQYGDHDQVIPGDIATLSGDPNLKGLAKLGEDFAKKYIKVLCKSNMLESLWFVDTPRLDQYYDATELKALRWFAKVAWKIIVLFDSTKLRFGNETRDNLMQLFKYRDKMQFVLNKSQKIKAESLIRQYGLFLNNLHNTFKHPDYDFEPKTFITSFPGYDKEFDPQRPMFNMFTRGSSQIYDLLWGSSRVGGDMKIFQVEKRAVMAMDHAEILLFLRDKMPKINRKKKRPEWEILVKDALEKAFTQMSYTNKTFNKENIKIENYLRGLREEKFKFSRDRKRIEKVQSLLKAGVPILRKFLYGAKDEFETEKKLVRLGLLKPTRGKRKLQNKKSKKHSSQKKSSNTPHRTSALASRASTSSVVSPVGARGSIADNAFGTFSVVSDSSFQRPNRKRTKMKRQTSKQHRNRKTIQEKTFSVASDDFYSNYKSSRRFKAASKTGKGTTHALMINFSVPEEPKPEDHLDIYSNLDDNEFESIRPKMTKQLTEQSIPQRQQTRSGRKPSNNSFAAQYNVCRVVTRIFRRDDNI